MEKKTIGTFIAALRKANGMTQKQLADILNVSDKAVSRWERDESMPDLTLIPVIAEVFNITCDELLKGQRNNPLAPPAESAPPKQTKQLQHILKQTETKYRIRSIISLGIALLGLVGAALCNIAFPNASWSFFIGLIFYIAAAVCQTIFTIQGYSALDDGNFDIDEVHACKLCLYRTATTVFSSILLLLAATVPFIAVRYSIYLSLRISFWTGARCITLAIVLCLLLSQIISHILAKCGALNFSILDRKLTGARLLVSLIPGLVLLTQTNLERFYHHTVFDTWYHLLMQFFWLIFTLSAVIAFIVYLVWKRALKKKYA